MSRPSTLAFSTALLPIVAGCALVTHDLGSVHGGRPIPGANLDLAVIKKLGPVIRSDNPSARFLDPIDTIENRIAISKFDDHTICVSMVDYQIPSNNVFASSSNPLQAHALTLVSSDGKTATDPVLSDLAHDEPAVQYEIQRDVNVGHDDVTNSEGYPVARVEKTEPRIVQEHVTLHRYAGRACFPTHEPFISQATKWVKLRLRAKLYANEYQFYFD